jgi:DNA-binding MarR family transcriptional regulator
LQKEYLELSKTEKDLGLKILMDLRRITRAIDLNSKKLSSETSLTAPQVVSLIAVYHHGALTLAEIAEQVHLSSSTMVGIIDRLEAKNLVIRERSKTDRRQVLIRITDEGQKMAKKSPLPLQEELIKSLSKLPEAQQRNLAKALELLVKMLDFKDS